MSDKKKLTVTVNRNTKWQEKSSIEVWCDGRNYDPNFESYRPIYSYKIETKEWEYTGNDIFGACNEQPNVVRGMKSLLAFLYACAEARTKDSDNFDLFPEHVREWAIHAESELQERYIQLMGEPE